MFGVVGWIIFGIVVGAIAKLLMPGRDPGGFIVTMLLGIAGALLGGFLGRALGWYGPGDSAGFLMSLVGRSCCWRSIAWQSAGARGSELRGTATRARSCSLRHRPAATGPAPHGIAREGIWLVVCPTAAS